MPKRWLPWPAGGCAPSSLTCVWLWKGVCNPIIAFFSNASWLILTFLISLSRKLEQEIEQHLRPFEEAVELVQTITGLQATTTAGILAEIGIDMTRFPSDKHLASWAGVCPGNKQSAGKRAPWEDDTRQ